MNTFRITSNARQLMAKSRELTGIGLVDADIEEALTRLLHSLNTESQLNEIGAGAMENRLLRILGNRLRMRRDFTLHPEIDDQPIVSPVILLGMGRTGSTKLQKLLAATGDFKYLPFWRVYSLSLLTGERDEDPGPRIQAADDYIRWFYDRSPDAIRTHPFSTFEPEEEIWIYEHALFTPNTTAYVHAPSYIEWYAQQDARDQVMYLKRCLKYLQWQFHDGDPRPWVLKTPLHFGWEKVLHDVFPDARFVVTHRDLDMVVPSCCSVLSAFFKAYSDGEFNRSIGQFLLEGVSIGAGQHMRYREERPDAMFKDIRYKELTADSEQVLEDIYAYLAMPFSDDARTAIRNWEKENKQHKLGVHKYTLEEYAMTSELVRSKHVDYLERFSHYLS